MAGHRPKPHVDTSINDTNATFQPTFVSASSAHQFLKVGMHGDNGTGKTRAAGTFPKPIILATDPGYSVLRQLPNSDDIHVAPISDKWGVNEKGERVLERGALPQVWDYYRWLASGDHDRETAVVDSITEIHKMVLDAVMRKPRHGREAPTIPCTDDYIEVAAKMKSLIRYFRDLPMHVVFTAHSKVMKQRDTIVGIKPDLSDKLCTELGGACDVVLYTHVVEHTDGEGVTKPWYVGQTVPLNGVMAKDRSGNLRAPVTLTDFPTLAKAYDIPFDEPVAEKPKAKSKAKAAADTAPDPDAGGEPEAPE